MKINIKDIIDSMPTDFNDIEKIRYIYISLGEMFSYNRDFMYKNLNEKTQKEIYDEEVEIDFNKKGKKEEKLKATCRQIADSCVQTINKLFSDNIAKKVGYNPDRKHHVAVLVTLKNKNYFMDLNNDLYRIQKGMRTEYFAPSKEILRKEKNNYIPLNEGLKKVRCTPIKKEQLEVIDEKIGYSHNGLYMDDAIEQLKLEMQDEKNWEKYRYIENYDKIKLKDKKDIIAKWKIDFIFKYIKNNKMKEMEVENFFRKLYSSILTKEEQRKRNFLITHIHIDGKPSIMYKIEGMNSTVYYIYNNTENGFNEITIDDINKMIYNGRLKYDNKYINSRVNQREWYDMW